MVVEHKTAYPPRNRPSPSQFRLVSTPLTPLRQRPHQPRRKLLKRPHLLTILPCLRTARLPERIPHRNSLHNHTVPKHLKRISSQTLSAEVSAGGLSVSDYALQSEEKIRDVEGEEG